MSIHKERIHYLDNLRALAMLLGILFHAAIAYGPNMVHFWPSAGGETSLALDAMAWFSHLWRMPLFFTISGFFAMLLLRRRGLAGFLKNRAMRIAVPFVIFMPLVLLGIIAGMGWAMQSVENPGPMLQMIIAMQDSGQQPEQPFSTAHLWFLYNLFQFCLVLALLFRMGLFEQRWLEALLHPWVLLLFMPLALVPALASLPAPHPAPEQLMPQAWSFGFYGVFFLLGAVLHGRLDTLEILHRWALPMIALSAALFAPVYAGYAEISNIAEALAAQGQTPTGPEHLWLVVPSACIAVWMTIACLILGKRFLNSGNRAMRYVADSSYWLYIVHLPVVWVVQYALMDVQWGAWPEFIVSTVVTVLFGLATYALFVRWTPVGILLNGRRVPLRQRPTGKRWDVSAA